EWAYSMKAVVLAHVFFNIPWITLWVARARAQVPEEEIDSARSLGAGKPSLIAYVVWPRIRAAWLTAGAQTFGFCVMSFALVLILGGGPPVDTLETAIYSRVRYGGLDLNGAVACAIWQLGLTAAPWLVLNRVGIAGVPVSGR